MYANDEVCRIGSAYDEWHPQQDCDEDDQASFHDIPSKRTPATDTKPHADTHADSLIIRLSGAAPL